MMRNNLAAMAVVLGPFCVPAFGVGTYTLSDLGRVDFHFNFNPAQIPHINNSGTVIWNPLDSNGSPRPWININGVSSPLPTNVWSTVTAINHNGDLAGGGVAGAQTQVNGVIHSIPPLGPQLDCTPRSMSDDGFATGTAGLTTATSFVFDGQTTSGVNGFGLSTSASSINSLHQVVGSARTPSGVDRAFVWQNGIATSLGAISHIVQRGERHQQLRRGLRGL